MAQKKVTGDQIDQSTLTSSGAALTPASVAASGTVSGSNLSGTNTGDQTLNSLLPTQTGNNGKVLGTDGSNASWVSAAGGTSYTLQPVRVATTANITLSNTQTIDGVAVVAGDRVLVKNQSTASQNGIYLCVSGGAWTRAADFDTGADTLTGGVIVPVIAGTKYAGNTFQCMNTTAITIGSTNISFSHLGGIAGQNLSSWTTQTINGTRAIAIGSNARAAANNTIAIGETNAGSSDSISITVNGGGAYSNSVVAIGASATSFGPGSVVIGTNSYVADTYGIAIGSAAKSNNNSAIAIGYNTQTDFAGEINICAGGFAQGGKDMSTSNFPMWYQTTNATSTELKTSSGNASTTPTGVIILTNNSAYIFDCDIVARQNTTGDMSSWNLKFAIKRGANAAATVLMGSPTATLIAQDAGASAWTVGVTADTTNGRPNISVTGEAAKTIRWVANIRMTKVSG